MGGVAATAATVGLGYLAKRNNWFSKKDRSDEDTSDTSDTAATSATTEDSAKVYDGLLAQKDMEQGKKKKNSASLESEGEDTFGGGTLGT